MTAFERGRASGIRTGIRIGLAVVTMLRVEAETDQRPSDVRRGRMAGYRRAYNELNRWLDDALPPRGRRRGCRGWRGSTNV